jgi:hypothetical protein
VDPQEISCPAGSFVFIPAETPHGFRVGGVPSRKLNLYTPAAMVGYFDELSAALRDGRADEQTLSEIADRYAMEVIGRVPEGYLYVIAEEHMDREWDTKGVVLIGTFRIPTDRVDEWRVAVRGMADFVHANVPRIIAFDMFVNDDETEGTVIQVHPDSTSLEQHLDAAAERIAQGTQMVQVVRIDLYGAPSERVVERLRDEAAGAWPVTVRPHYLGFTRVDPSP